MRRLWYLDTSVALHALLPTDNTRAAEWLDRAHRDGDVYSSALLELEIVRVLRRESIPVEHAGEVLDRVHLVSINDGVLRSAAAITPHIRSLESIHLATCALLGGDAVLVTHDSRMREVAENLGRATTDPIG